MSDDEPDADDEKPQAAGAESAADPKAIRKRTISAKQRVSRSRDWWIAAFATDVGRAELYGILREAHAFEERFACGPNGFPQPEATWFEAGKQSFGLTLYHSWLKLDRDGVNLMLEENDPRFAVKKK